MPNHFAAEAGGFHVSPTAGLADFRGQRASEFQMRPIPAQIDHRSSAESVSGGDLEPYGSQSRPPQPRMTANPTQAANPARHIVLSKNKTVMRDISADTASESMTFDML